MKHKSQLMEPRYLLAALLIVTGIAYGTALERAPLLDDVAQIQHVRQFNSLSDLFGVDAYEFFRPIKNVIFWVLIHMAPDSPAVWHCVSLLLFLLCGYVLWKYLAVILRSDWWALAALMFWLWAPTQVGPVSWLSCSNILLMTTCVLGCLLAAEGGKTGTRERRRGALACSGLLLVALFSYELAVTTLLLVVLRDWMRNPRRVRWPLYISLALVTLIFLAVRFLVMADAGPVQNDHIAPTTLAPLRLSSYAGYFIVYHLVWWLWPFGRQLILATFNAETVSLQVLGLAWAALACLVGLSWSVRRKLPCVAFGLAWYVVTILPLSNLLPLFSGPIADYYLVLPSVGLSLAAASLIKAAWSRSGKGFVRMVLLVPVVLWAGARLAETIAWVPNWATEERLLRATLEAQPQTYTAKANLARLVAAQGDLKQAEMLAREAVDLAPWYVQGYYSLGDTLMRGGRYDEARKYLRKAAELRPNDPVPLVLLGHMEDLAGNAELSKNLYGEALGKPWHYSYSKTAVINLAGAYFLEGDVRSAVSVWETGYEHDPDAIEFRVMLAVGYCRLGEYDKARPHAQYVVLQGHGLPPQVLEALDLE